MMFNHQQLMLTCISLYRLYLVIRSVRGQPQPSRATKTRVGFHQLQLLSIRASYFVKTAESLTNKCQLQVTRLLPLLAATFGLVFAVWWGKLFCLCMMIYSVYILEISYICNFTTIFEGLQFGPSQCCYSVYVWATAMNTIISTR